MTSEMAYAHPDLRVLAHDLDEQLLAWGLGELFVTDILRDPSFYPGKRWSWHYCGCAMDIRIKNLTAEDRARVVAWIQGWAKSGTDLKCDVVLESDAARGPHIHIEIEDADWRRKYEQQTGRYTGAS
jgi:hypothetical protein